MEQCLPCKYACKKNEVFFCKKREIQFSVREGNEDRLHITNECEKVNPLDDCDLYKKSLSKKITELIFKLNKGKPPIGTSTQDHMDDPEFIKERIKRLEEYDDDNED